MVVTLSGGLGDCLLASPFIRQFRRSGRYDRILCALPTGAAQLYDRNPHIDQLIPCPAQDLWLWALPEADADVFCPYVSVQTAAPGGSPRELRSQWLLAANQTSVPLVRQVAHHHGIHLDDESMEMFTDPEDEAWAERRLVPWRDRPCVLVNPSTALPHKMYPLHLWQQVAQLLLPHAHVLELCDGPDSALGTQVITPVPSLRQSAALVRRCQCVVTVDSFAAHLAAAVGTPAVVLFGPTNPATFGHPSATCIRATDCPVCADTPRRRTCPRPACMTQIAPAAVVNAVLDRISQRPVRSAVEGA